MRLLLSNDDGVFAPGLRALAQAAAKIGEVWVVAPDRQRSASSHGISARQPLLVEPVDIGIPQIRAFAVSGTPVDCVKWAITVIGRNHPFDWMFSGINEGANLATDVLYSGTVAAAGEAALQHVPALALSLCGPPFPFQSAAAACLKLFAWIQHWSWPPDTFLNVNLPAQQPDRAAWQFTALGARGYSDVFVCADEHDQTATQIPQQRTVYHYAGEALDELDGPGTDVDAVRSGAVSITPLQYHFTHETWLQELQQQALARVQKGENNRGR
ncbi:MAG: 5'/3'-nucleotidase SurE [Alicyclobacillus sp.]|nr:5'/3'-nucleotidase SurE [Alicyclobacillus sp.]